jgi:hypothetical protein
MSLNILNVVETFLVLNANDNIVSCTEMWKGLVAVGATVEMEFEFGAKAEIGKMGYRSASEVSRPMKGDTGLLAKIELCQVEVPSCKVPMFQP